jgi:uncharacterized protein HemX
MAALSTIALLTLAAGAATYQGVQSKNAADDAEEAAAKQEATQLKLQNDAAVKEQAENTRAAGLQQRQLTRSLTKGASTSTTPNLSAGSGGGKQLIGQ